MIVSPFTNQYYKFISNSDNGIYGSVNLKFSLLYIFIKKHCLNFAYSTTYVQN